MMKFWSSLKPYVFSPDFYVATVVLFVSLHWLPYDLERANLEKVYEVGITVLSIIFSIFFASLTVIMAFPDNRFIVFIEKPDKDGENGGIFSRILTYFRGTLTALFVSLVITIVMYIYTLFTSGNEETARTLFCIFNAIFTYSLIATFSSVIFTLKITSRRASFLINRPDSRPKDNDEEETE